MDVQATVLLSHEMALRRRLDITANNMANVNTVGFKREQAVFHQYVASTPDAPVADARQTSYVLDFGVAHDMSAGAFEATSNHLDIMIDGPGYLSVETPEGGVAYTRAGHLQILKSGDLAIASGHRVLGEGGTPINIPADQAAQLTIGPDGNISGPSGVIGRLALTAFDDERLLDPRGDGLLTGQGGRAVPAQAARIKAGGVEASNVQPIVETTQMVDILRSYQMSQRISDSIDDMRRRTIERLGRGN